ncbi:NAD(P)H quinone oxidoreductase, PIG3 family [Catenulispora acidiphila DSM 44928]|uniref:NAD(P)H quinone oxidoreductase, PIG3 family n=1 Tax=Catenulispora acidiphila (strain DSM 44928 / JCM 14897 / NBRC 102108 / NRRL B-24433 / ID139908) TaxID=479433 RepID=C7QH92_CATAD|nr:NAD(P)H-quinone oxidoreductase [Catenulispora acidiphila]ACU69031.1 NAD(P)H quinone oxidoreductase, PIG3 family [Catenulispora acidiphila DSM 44928]
MRAITIAEPGGPEQLVWTEVPDPVVAAGEVLIQVAATAVNRADILQRRGFYTPPPGASSYPGLECSGRVVEVGAGVSGFVPGDEVVALLTGGGYAELVAVPAGQVAPLPKGLSALAAGGLMETVCTVWSNVFMLAGLQAGQTLLVHGGSSGIGTTAIQLAHQLGARVIVTAGTAAKLRACRDLGADVGVNYRDEDFVERVAEVTDGQGVDVILDNMGAVYLDRNVQALAVDGRLVIIGLQGGVTGEVNLNTLLRKRAGISATTLRARPSEEKARIVAAARDAVWPLIEQGRFRVVVDRVLPVDRAAEAHRVVEDSGHVGKVVLDVATVRGSSS